MVLTMNRIALSTFLIAALEFQQSSVLGFCIPNIQRSALKISQPNTIEPRSNFVRQSCRFLSSGDDEEEYEYEYEEVEYEEEEDDAEYEYVDVDEDDAEGLDEEDEEDIPLEDDLDDPNYSAQKKLVEETIARRENLGEIREKLEGPGSPSFFKKNLVEFIDGAYEQSGLDDKDVEKMMKKIGITASEAQEVIGEKAAAESDQEPIEMTEAFLTNLGSDSNVFPSDDDELMKQNGIKNDDLVRLQKSLEGLVGTIKGFEDGSLVDNKQAMIRPHYELDQLDRQTLDEINLCLNASATDANGIEYSEAIKNEDPIRWLLYDLDFDVANLMLAACKHSPTAPLLLNQWMPQLCAYSRYADVRDNAFQFTWEDCEKADMDELKRYYQGLGYDQIPTFKPRDTNIVELETEYDQEDMTMAAFENWMDEVYIEDDENLYFDDEDFQPENNVFDFDYAMQDSDHITSFKAELRDFKDEHSNETQAWKNKYVRETNYTFSKDDTGAEQFRGHLVVACCGSDQDLALAEKITNRMEEEFDKMVYVETRVYSHARQEDNLYEIWLESYDIEQLHSRRGAFYNSKQWLGPPDVDDEQLDSIVKRVEFLIGDDARYSYRLHEFVDLV